MPRFGAGADFQGPLTWLRHRAVGGSGSLIGADNLKVIGKWYIFQTKLE